MTTNQFEQDQPATTISDSTPIHIPITPATASRREQVAVGVGAGLASLCVLGLIIFGISRIGADNQPEGPMAFQDLTELTSDESDPSLLLESTTSTTDLAVVPTSERPPDLRRKSEANDPSATTTTTILTADNQAKALNFQAAATQVMKDVDTVGARSIVALGRGLCSVGSDVDTLDSFAIMVGLLWVGLETEMRSLFSNKLENFRAASEIALQTFCPETFDRLSA